jgi:alkanesulfonate monooxygenase SsuD/methylene tetrahydromethanopterin reductase-like flavin-dependent oxidoreductase (luciferase family)
MEFETILYEVEDRVATITLNPPGAPVQRPHPPLWLGGNSARTRDRVARWGQGGGATPARLTRVALLGPLDLLRF